MPSMRHCGFARGGFGQDQHRAERSTCTHQGADFENDLTNLRCLAGAIAIPVGSAAARGSTGGAGATAVPRAR
jgi:hypothetical protein